MASGSAERASSASCRRLPPQALPRPRSRAAGSLIPDLDELPEPAVQGGDVGRGAREGP